MRNAAISDKHDDASHHFLIVELKRIKISTVGLKNGPELLNDISPLALAITIEPLQNFKVGTVTSPNCLLDVPLDDGRILFPDARKHERLPVGRLNPFPQEVQEIRIVRKDDHLSTLLSATKNLVDRVAAAKAVHAFEGIVKNDVLVGPIGVLFELGEKEGQS